MHFVIRRLTALVPTMIVMSFAVFVLVRVVPGDVVALLSDGQILSPEQVEALQEEHDLDEPIPMQYLTYMWEIARGDFGSSIWTGKAVLGEFLHRLPVTLQLAGFASLFSVLLGVPIGVVSALKKDRWPDYLLRGLSVGGLSVPGFWIGTLAVVLPSIWWGYVPPLTYVSPMDDPATNLRQFTLPAFLMSLYPASFLMRMTRSSLLDILGADYIRTARAKGLLYRSVIVRHALRNGVVPIMTLFGTQFAALLGGTVIFETIFNLQGVGSYIVNAVSQRDYPIIQSVNLFLGLAVLLINLIIDLSYGLLDPRIRSSS